MKKINSLSFRIITRVLLISLTLFILTLSFYYYYSRDVIREVAQKDAIQLAENIKGNIEQKFQPIEKIPQIISLMMEQDFLDKDSLLSFLHTVLTNNENVYGAAIAFEPDYYSEKGRYFSPYAYRDGDSIKTMFLGGTNYEYFYMDWYQIPKMINTPYWSEPYYDEGGGGFLMATYSVPFFKRSPEGRRFAGIATVDVALKYLTDIVSDIKIFETGYVFMLSHNGWVLAHPDSTQVMNESIFSTSEAWGEPLLREIGRDLKQGKSNFRDYNLKNKDKRWIYYTPLPSGKYSIGVVYHDNEVFASLNHMTVIMIIQILVGLILLTLLTIRIVNGIASPLTHFANSAQQIAAGDFNVKLPIIKTKDEMLELHNAFSYMQDQLTEYVENLLKTTAAKESMESQLRIASEIQMGMIPKNDSICPEFNEFSICGIMNPAKEVGGDLYNFFKIDEEYLGFTIGDVSGKGIPAALFMAMTNILIKAIAKSGLSPADVLYNANNELCKENDQCMFVTLLFGKLNIKTGEVIYANAGHNPFIHIKGACSSEYREMSPGMVLAAFEGFKFINESMTLKRNETIYMYTDGVTEAMNIDRNLFGEKRLLELIEKSGSMTVHELIKETTNGIADFVDGNEQSDDITILALRYLPEGKVENSAI
ncbi:MAG: SpoIIE family protein phosphatase [Bacteroidota bacterium]